MKAFWIWAHHDRRDAILGTKSGHAGNRIHAHTHASHYASFRKQDKATTCSTSPPHNFSSTTLPRPLILQVRNPDELVGVVICADTDTDTPGADLPTERGLMFQRYNTDKQAWVLDPEHRVVEVRVMSWLSS